MKFLYIHVLAHKYIYIDYPSYGYVDNNTNGMMKFDHKRLQFLQIIINKWEASNSKSYERALQA